MGVLHIEEEKKRAQCAKMWRKSFIIGTFHVIFSSYPDIERIRVKEEKSVPERK